MENFIDRLKGNWASYLHQFPFEWWVSLTFKELIKSEFAKKKLETWSLKLIKEERLQIAYFCVINEVNRIHLHLLVLGRNRYGKSLLDVSVERWQQAWKDQSRIQPIYDIAGVSNYFERNTILRDNSVSEVIPFNIKLLEKVQVTKNFDSRRKVKHHLLDLNELSDFRCKNKKSVQSQMKELVDGFKQRKEKP